MRTSETLEGAQGESGKSRWFQMGLLAAGAAAPLIARWRALRAAERAEALREQANERWNEALAWAAQTRPQDVIQGAIQERLPQAQESLRQMSAATRDALRRLPLPMTSDTEPPAPIVAPALPATSRRRANAAIWAVGVGVGLIAAGAVAYIVLRNRANANNDDTLVEIPLTAEQVTEATQVAQEQAATIPTDGPAITTESPAQEPHVAEPMPFNESEMEGAEYVGNILTRVYHPIDSKRLPAPEHRTYFATLAEAEDAGYRPDASESAASRRSDTSPRNE